MGRHYKTARPQFINDIIYQPPWELAQQVMATKQKGYDNAMQSTELIRNLLDVKHLNFEDDRVKGVKEKYNSEIDELANQISQNPGDYNKILPNLRNLTREIDSSRKEGDIAQIERRHAAWQQWQTDNEDIKKSDPNLYNRLASHWYEDIKNKSADNIDAQFAGQKGIVRPDINSKDMRDALAKFKANATEYSNGRYKIGNKWLNEEEVQQGAYDLYMSNPNVQGYMNQMGNVLKDPGFYDEESGELKKIYGLYDKNGNAITQDEAKTLKNDWDKLSDAEKQKQGLPFNRKLNMDHALAQGFRGWGNILGFKERTQDVDQYGLQSAKSADARKLQSQKDAQAMKRLQYGKAADKDKMITDYALKTQFERDKIKMELENDAMKGDADAIAALQYIYPKETLGVIKNPDSSYDKDFNTVMNNREASTAPNDGKTYFTAAPGTSAYQENYRLTQATTHARSKMNTNTKAKEYLDWLGDRRPTEETAKKYLESKGVYQKPSFQSSYAEQFADNARWTPGFVKNENAEKWDEIYEIGKQYEKSIKTWYEDENKKSIPVSVNPLSIEGKGILMNELSNGMTNYFTTDTDGNPINEQIEIKDVLGVTGGNNQSNIGFQVKDEDDNLRWVFPNVNNDNVKQLSRNLSLLSIADKNSAFGKEAMNSEVNRIKSQILSGVGDTKANVVDIVGGRVIMKMLPNGNVEVYDQDGNTKIDTYSSVNQFVEYLYK